jgi:two-component system, OmpR family, alkaline phosphatase synthesis response regulator PhoP
MKMPKILIIEDDENIGMAMEDDLTFEGYNVDRITNGKQGLKKAQRIHFDLIILDIMLPELDGFEICKELRKLNIMTPLIMLTAKGQEIDKVLGLELGADDYVTKPFSPRELLARIKAILRRNIQIVQSLNVVNFGNVEINFKTYQAKKGLKKLNLTALEFTLLHFLITNKDEVLSRNLILDEIWGKDVVVTSRTVDTHIANLRKKIEHDPACPTHIISVRGVGYKFNLE